MKTEEEQNDVEEMKIAYKNELEKSIDIANEIENAKL